MACSRLSWCFWWCPTPTFFAHVNLTLVTSQHVTPCPLFHTLTRSPLSSFGRCRTGSPPGPWTTPRLQRCHRTRSGHLERGGGGAGVRGEQTCLPLVAVAHQRLRLWVTLLGKNAADRFPVWRGSSRWCWPAPPWSLASGVLRPGGSSPSWLWSVWPTRCPSAGLCAKTHGKSV